MYSNSHFYSISPWIGIFSLILNVLFWILLFWAFFALIKALSHHQKGDYKTEDKEDDSNLEIIKSRYAKGEITKKEYEEMKKELS